VKNFGLFLIILVAAIGLNCQAQNPPAPDAPPPQVAPAQTQVEPPPQIPEGVEATAHPKPPEMTDPLLEGFFEDIEYNPTDKRDPFLPYLSPAFRITKGAEVPLEPLQKFALSELKLIGIIWDVGTPKALIEDPSGKSHIIVENTKMGSGMGYVAAIREGEIIVVEQQISSEGKKSFETKILKLSSIKGTP
jgi:type IV pilus assembly protein PilP